MLAAAQRLLREALPEWIGGLLLAVTTPLVLALLRVFSSGTLLAIGLYLVALVALTRVVRSRAASRVIPDAVVWRYSLRQRASALILLVTASLLLAAVLHQELIRATVVGRCTWAHDPLQDVGEPPSLSCHVANGGSDVARNVVLDLPFLCAQASLDGQEASRRFGEEVFRVDAKPPARFSVGEIKAGGRAEMHFVLVAMRLQRPRAEWCQPQAYSLFDGEKQGRVEISGCQVE